MEAVVVKDLEKQNSRMGSSSEPHFEHLPLEAARDVRTPISSPNGVPALSSPDIEALGAGDSSLDCAHCDAGLGNLNKTISNSLQDG